jgi:ribosome-interacting GTPase 1
LGAGEAKELHHLTSDANFIQATSAHLGLLKAKLAKLKRELLMPTGGGGGAGVGFDVAKVDC